MDYVRVQATPAAATRDTRVFVITTDLADPAYQAYLLLRNAFTIGLSWPAPASSRPGRPR